MKKWLPAAGLVVALSVLALLGQHKEPDRRRAIALKGFEQVAYPVAEAKKTAPVRWIEKGTNLLVARRWVYDFDSSQFLPLKFETEQRSASGGHTDVDLSFNADGTQVLATETTGVRYGPVRGPLRGWVPIPPFRTDDGGIAETTAFWLDDTTIHMRRYARFGTNEECRLFATEEMKDKGVTPCLKGAFHLVYHVERSAKGLAAVYSAGEGHPGVNLLRFGRTPAGTGLEQQQAIREFDLYPFGPLHATFTLAGDRVQIQTPCQLDKKRGCVAADGVSAIEGGPWRYYETDAAASHLLLVEENLPAHFAPDPIDGRWFAWSDGARLCLKERTEEKIAWCRAMPKQVLQ